MKVLYAIPLWDADSYQLRGVLSRYVYDLDRASGEHVRFLQLGDPAQSGANHQKLRTPRLVRLERDGAKAYAEQIHVTGREDYHLLGESAKLAESLSVAAEVPCIVFTREPSGPPLAIFPIKDSWFRGTEESRVFARELRLALTDLVAAIEREAAPDLEGYLQEWIGTLTDKVDSMIGNSTSAARGGIAEQAPDRHAEEGNPPTYCRVITRGGISGLTKSQYEDLLRRRDEYDMFIDALTGEASCRDGESAPRAAKLTAAEQGILIDLIMAGKPTRPFNTKAGSTSASIDAASRLFEKARCKVDVKLGRYNYRAFRLNRNPGDKRLKTFEFSPPDDLQYCMIVPV